MVSSVAARAEPTAKATGGLLVRLASWCGGFARRRLSRFKFLSGDRGRFLGALGCILRHLRFLGIFGYVVSERSCLPSTLDGIVALDSAHTPD
ncbi:MAG: hypothetical protein WAL26_24985, partial [Mycobacterium sp.]